MSDIQALRAQAVAKRDAWARVIEALDAAIGTAALSPGESVNGTKARGGRQASKQASKAKRTPAPRSLPDDPRPRLDLVPARDAAIKAALRSGPRPSSALLHALPMETGQSADQREDALRNALTRLRLKKEIRQVEDGWALA